MRMALGDEPGLFRQVPKRPKGMHHRTYERRINELQRIEDWVRVSISRRTGNLLEELLPEWKGVSDTQRLPESRQYRLSVCWAHESRERLSPWIMKFRLMRRNSI